MKITNLDVGGYGVWTDLRVERFSDSINVFYGPNEAGKTTLLQFIRAMFYGFSPERRRYLPPVHGGQPGGALDVSGAHGRFQIARHGDDCDADGDANEQLTLTAPDGTRQGEHFIKVLLSNVDEAVFNNVFAIGLREIQELATLSDTEAAEHLYNLTAGLDRVSLVEVLGALEASRNHILAAAGGPCQVSQLLGEREKIRLEIEELATINHRHGRLAAERDQIQGDVTRLEEEANRTERLADVADLAAAVRERWLERAAIDEQIAAIGPQRAMPDGAIERLDTLNANIRRHEERVEQLENRRKELKREFAGLEINDALWRQAARIEALKEQEPWIVQLQNQIGELDAEIAKLSSGLAAEGEQLGLGADPTAWPELSAKRLASLRSPAKSLRQTRLAMDEANQAAASAAENVASLSRQIESALSKRGGADLAATMDRAGNLVSQFRRRLQLDERLDQLDRHRNELEERCRRFEDRPTLPLGAIVSLGATFGIGVLLVIVWLFLSNAFIGAAGSVLAVLSLAGGVAIIVGNMLKERANALQLEAGQKQLAVLQSQLDAAKNDRDALDGQLPSGGGPIAMRLQTAEKDLAVLEELVPVETRRNAARQESDAAVRRANEAQQQHKAARRRWADTLSTAGLPERIPASQARKLIESGDRIAEIQNRIAGRREELARRRRELDAFVARILQLAAEAGVEGSGSEGRGARGEGRESSGRLSLATDHWPPTTSPANPFAADPLSLIRILGDAASEQEAAVARRETLRRDAKRVRAAIAKRENAVARLKHRRRQLLIEAGVKEEADFRGRALESARSEILRDRRDAIAREIESALASHCSEDAIRKQLKDDSPAALDGRRAELRARLAGIREELRGLLEKRGRLAEQIEAIAGDRRLPSKYLDLAVLEKRLADALHRWRVLAATCSILDTIRDEYQRNRQPETLQEASGYLERLTQGRYCRVWTPLGEHALRVDDAEGNALPVEALSRGTREQLFLSLRLALVSSYARRGAPLPLVLDDVLVNFDDDRAKAAAAVLRDFAAASGHQLIIFTCHEHVLKLFKSLRVQVARLPDNHQPGQVVTLTDYRADDKPKREKRSSSRKIAAKEEIETIDEPSDDPDLESNDEDEESPDESLWDDEVEENGELDDDSIAAA